jgi:hypothetical protein
MGAVELAILVTASWPLLSAGLLNDGARSSDNESSETGAPFLGGEPWHKVQ